MDCSANTLRTEKKHRSRGGMCSHEARRVAQAEIPVHNQVLVASGDPGNPAAGEDPSREAKSAMSGGSAVGNLDAYSHSTCCTITFAPGKPRPAPRGAGRALSVIQPSSMATRGGVSPPAVDSKAHCGGVADRFFPISLEIRVFFQQSLRPAMLPLYTAGVDTASSAPGPLLRTPCSNCP